MLRLRREDLRQRGIRIHWKEDLQTQEPFLMKWVNIFNTNQYLYERPSDIEGFSKIINKGHYDDN